MESRRKELDAGARVAHISSDPSLVCCLLQFSIQALAFAITINGWIQNHFSVCMFSHFTGIIVCNNQLN